MSDRLGHYMGRETREERVRRLRERYKEREVEIEELCIGTDFDVNAWQGKKIADRSYKLLLLPCSTFADIHCEMSSAPL